MSHADLTKPPLAPKPKILNHLASIAASKFHPSLSRSGALHNSNSMSRGPKPPIAPKPKISADNDPAIIQRSSVHANNTFNKCTNGKLEGELYEGNQCNNTELLEAEVGDEYIVISEDELIDQDYDFEHEQEPTENEILYTPEEAGEEEVNCTNNNEICDLEINVLENNDTEPVGDDSAQSIKIQALGSCEAPEKEKKDASKDGYENVDCETDPNEKKMNFTDESDETLRELDLVKDNSEYNMDNKILNGDDALEDTICEDIILRHLEEPKSSSEDQPPICEDPGKEGQPQILEEEQLNANTEIGPTDNDGDESALNIETELTEDVYASPDYHLTNDSEEGDTGLELYEPGPDPEGTLRETTNEANVEKVEEIDPDNECETSIEQEENTDDGYQTTEMKSEEETSETVCDTREDSEEQHDDVVDTETMEDSCQIIPFEKECSEDTPESPEKNLDEDLPSEETEIINDNQPFSLQDVNGLESDSQLAERSRSDVLLGNQSISECALEGTQSDNQMFEVDHSNGEETIPSTVYETSAEDTWNSIGELDICHHRKTETDSSREYVLDEISPVPVVVVLDNEEEIASDSLDDPYVLGDSLSSANEILCTGKEMGEADVHDSSSDFREGGSMDSENHLLSIDRKNIVTRTRSLSGKVPGYVPETVPEETGPDTELQPSTTASTTTEDVSHSFSLSDGKSMELNRALPAKPRRFVLYPRSYSVEGRDIPVSVYRESDSSMLDYNRINRTEDLSLPYVIGSSGSFSQRNHLPSSGVSTPSSVVDIPPPFELACITKKPITKSSPSLLIENESPDKYCKKKKSSFKKFLTLKFKKKTENKVHVDVHISSSRSSSESSYHGPSRVIELDRRSLSSSPQLISRTGKLRASESPTVLFYKDGKRKGTPKTFSRSVSRVESFEDRSRPHFMPLPLTKPRSISFPNADTSDYENIPAMNSDYENIQIPPRRPTRAGTFTEFFEDPSRALSAANENDGYVDMSSFTAFENNKQQPTNQETESAYTEPYKVCPISAIPVEDIISDEEQKSSGDEDVNQGDSNLTHKLEDPLWRRVVSSGNAAEALLTAGVRFQQKEEVESLVKGVEVHSAFHPSVKEGQSRAHLIAQELVSSEKVYVEMLRLLQMDFYEAVLKVLGDDDGNDYEEAKLKNGLNEIPEIYKLHQEILEELEEKVLNWEDHQKVADIFLSRVSRFGHHTAYIVQFDRNLALMDEARLKSSQLDTIIREFEQFCGGSPLNVKHQLLKVVQRVFQYHVLLTDYLNNLCPDSAEYEETQAALLIISEVADRANDSMQQGENLQKLVHIEYSVKGQSNLLQPGRVFVKEGTLMKVCGKNRHPRHLFLMNDVLLYTFPQKDGKYRLKNTLAVSGMRVSRPVTEKAQNVLKIEYAENCLTLSASSCSERDEWYSCINRSIPDDYRAHSTAAFHNSVELRERLGMSLGERPPTLVPVSHVMMCMNCGCDFKLTLRRHHCHACGKIICRNCSRNKYPLKYLKDRLAKVCNGCYAELKRRERPISMSFPTSSSRFSGSAFSSVFHNIHYSSFKRQKKIPSALLEVAASGEGSSISGYLSRCKKGKRHWKKLWFVIKGKVLYTYTASEDKVATESLPLLGFTIVPEKEDGNMDAVFHLYHKQTLFYSFRAEDNNAAERWIEAMKEASVL
ncbi:FYVE, RhoGEF and PH domain-containing protein 5 isoform X3 [Rhineura floridana]|uniref:FYVE, RhoGEF and PH domain-containing protein 5 isoform X3 n=1 Tax=Rhineura floridana TaxID=261503 RepID=UPI002AC844F3|nr:FYVE, RhoGEF and PH domain-containing protein 5 isoform X3 [Rhineura floridana]